jgi:hypothetical protein
MLKCYFIQNDVRFLVSSISFEMLFESPRSVGIDIHTPLIFFYFFYMRICQVLRVKIRIL